MYTHRTVTKKTVRTSDGVRLTVSYFHPRHQPLSGVIFIPPLIGGSYIQYYREFTYLTDAGFLIVSFNYRGHHKSEGKFDVQTSFSDAWEVVQHVKHEFPDEKMFAIGTCFGSMPLFSILSQDPNAFDKVTFINAINNLRQSSSPWESFKIYVREAFPRHLFNVAGLVTVVLNQLFPEVDKSPDHFGILRYDNVHVYRVAWEYFFYDTPDAVRDLACPALVCYGKDDLLLKLNDPARQHAYEATFRRFFRNVEFLTYDVNHYFDGVEPHAAERIIAFFLNP